MPKGRWRRLAASTVLAAATTFAVAASATAATTYRVSGEQIVEPTGQTVMRGGLIGDWYYTSFNEVATSPIYQANGTELFAGCLDVKLDGRCDHDPSGTLSFRFDYWAQFDEHGGLVWGTCTHPVTGGTGAFAGAAGVLAMVDSPTPQGVHTDYIGTLTLPRGRGHHGEASAATVARASGAARGC